jgi:hypothetical protein
VVSLLRQSPSTWRPSARYISIGAFLTLSKTLLALIACFAVSDGSVLLAVRLVCPSPGLSSPLFRRLFPRTRMIIACFGRPVLSRFLAFFGLANLPVRGRLIPWSTCRFQTCPLIRRVAFTSSSRRQKRTGSAEACLSPSVRRENASAPYLRFAVTFRFEVRYLGNTWYLLQSQFQDWRGDHSSVCGHPGSLN